MKFKNQILFLVIAGITIFSCTKKEESTPSVAVGNYGPQLPAQAYDYSYNAQFFGGSQNLHLTNENITLGRVLFYDKALSFNNQISCGSCHFQEKGFADNVKFHKGVTGNNLKRNTLSITGNNFLMFWDGRANSMQDLVLKPVANHEEMMQDPNALVNKIKQIAYYKDLFVKAYGDDEINLERIENALASFSVCIVPSQTKFDVGIANLFNQIGFNFIDSTSSLSNFNAQENKGMSLFYGKARCGNCHHPEIITGYYGGEPYANIGLDLDYSDKGLGSLANDAAQNGKFKIPNIRNIALTAPYMHDGRFNTLEEVVEHYNSRIKPNANLSYHLYQNGTNSNTTVVSPVRLGLSGDEKNALVAFLKTLTDEHMKKDIKFSNPF